MRHEEEAFTAGSPSTKRPLQKTKTLKAGANPSRSCCWKLPRCPLRNRPYCQHRVHQRRLLSHEQRLTSSTTSATKNQPGERCCLLPSEPRTEAPTPFQLAGSEPDQDSSRSYNDLERIADPKASDECSHDEKINRLSTNIATRPGQRDLPDANDLQSSAGLVRNTAFRVDPREYHHPAPVPGPQTMENRFSLEVPPEKLVHRDTTDTSTSKSSSRAKHRGTDDVHQVLGLRSTSLDSPGFPSLEDAHSRIPGSGCRERTPEYDRENVLENTAFNDLDEDGDDPRIVETNACLDVPGGRLFGIVCLGRGLASGCAVSGSPKRSFVSTGNPEYPSVNELSVDSRTCGSSDDREKWKKPRRRRCRRCSETRRRKLQESWRDEELDEDETDEDEDTDGRLLGEVLEGDGASSVNTARSGGPSLSTKRTSRRKSKKRRRGRGARAREGKWSSPWREKRKPEASRKRFAGWHAEGILRQADTGRFFKSDKTFSRKRGVRSYGLSLVLYLLALPILCSSDSSAPVASAFAQKSPLTHGDNFTARNSSSQHQANHEMRREGLIDDDMPHPYNEYSWEINQINPWLSACDLAGPAPADLQGSCGPPEVPKSCPERCSSRNQADLNKAFAEVIEAFGINERARSGAGGSRWRPAGTTTTNKSAGNKIKDDDRKNKRTEETADAAAPVQCLFYLEASHKRDICRDNFGRGSSLSFSNTRENRYWYLSALRLRHCCERPVVNALAPGKGGPLEDVLNGGPKCSDALDKILVVDSLAARLHCEFEEVLARYDCGQSYSVIHNCTHCKEAYRKWVCSSLVPYFAHGGPPALETSTNTWLGSRLRPCRSFCQSVEQRCPYLLPGDRAPAYPTQYAGEPTFLCRDPNIPETGEQAMRALHGNERDECCFHACSEDEPGLGVCANCTDLKAPSNRAGHDIPTAPQCEITSTSSIQSGSTGEKSTDSRIGSASSVESSSASPSTSTTTSASFCGGGGVGSMPSSSGQSTTQTPPPSSISLICMFWIWAALISLCTGQTVFPWSPPSSLSMGDYSTRRGAGARSRKRRKRLEKREIFGRRKSEEEERRTKHVGTGKKMDIGKMAALSITSSAGSASRSFLRSSTRLLVSRRRMRRDLSVILILKFTRVFLVALTTIIMKNNYYRNYYIDLFNIVRQYSLVMLFMLVRYYEKCHFRLSRINYVLIIINESSSFRKRPHQIGHLAPRCRTPAAAVAAAAIASSFSLLCRRHDYDYDYHYYCYYYYYYYCCYYEAKFHRVFSPSQGQRLDLERFERKLDDYAAPRPPRGKRRKRRPRIWRRRRRRRRIYVVRFFFSNLHYCFFSYAHSQRPSFVATRTSGLPDHTKSTSPTTTQFYYCDHYHYFFHYYYLCCYFCYYFHSHYQYPSSCHYYYNGAITWWWWWWCWWWWSSSPSWSSFCIFLYPSRASSRAHRDRPP
ncbi:uncharacterized protein Mid1 [Venturia canescens]|uniref:uncharacterized protein Mid1 n=1 Tax=Venturia canescens TaxID=32260 RepID=UPI001C9CC0BD|nr:uncharacterized protein LOC122418124 [Venturia canescens]